MDRPDGMYEYKFQGHQKRTYWYHSHVWAPRSSSAYIGALVIDAKEPEPFSYDRITVVLPEATGRMKIQRGTGQAQENSRLLQPATNAAVG